LSDVRNYRNNKKCRKMLLLVRGNGKFIFKSYCMPVLMYGIETWTWTKADILEQI
jgi:hypothetical protein